MEHFKFDEAGSQLLREVVAPHWPISNYTAAVEWSERCPVRSIGSVFCGDLPVNLANEAMYSRTLIGLDVLRRPENWDGRAASARELRGAWTNGGFAAAVGEALCRIADDTHLNPELFTSAMRLVLNPVLNARVKDELASSLTFNIQIVVEDTLAPSFSFCWPDDLAMLVLVGLPSYDTINRLFVRNLALERSEDHDCRLVDDYYFSFHCRESGFLITSA